MGQLDINLLRVALHLVSTQIESALRHADTDPGRAVENAAVGAGLLDFIGYQFYQFSEETVEGVEGLWNRKRLEGIDIASQVHETILQNTSSSEIRWTSSLWVSLAHTDPADGGVPMTGRQRVAMISLNGKVRLNTGAIRFGPLPHVLAWYGVWDTEEDGILLESGRIDPTDMTIVGVNTLEIAPGGLVCPV